MFYAISLWLLLLYVAGSIVAGYLAARASGSVGVGVLVGLATFILLIVGPFVVARFRRVG